MGIRNRLGFWKDLDKNDETYLYYFNRLKELAISEFEWKGLPEEIDSRFMELLLFDYGSCVFFKDDVLGYLVLQYTIQGKLNVYRIPIKRRAFAITGYNKNLNENNSVIIWNNMMKTSSVPVVNHFARKLYNIDRTIDINIHAQKTPIVILCDENQKLTLTNLYSQYTGNTPIIFADKNIDMKSVNVLKTDAPFLSDRLWDIKTEIWSEAINYFGISSQGTAKRERLIVSEVEATQGSTMTSKFSRLVMRQTACEQINKMFGLNVSVDYRLDNYQIERLEETTQIQMGGANEQVHDRG